MFTMLMMFLLGKKILPAGRQVLPKNFTIISFILCSFLLGLGFNVYNRIQNDGYVKGAKSPTPIPSPSPTPTPTLTPTPVSESSQKEVAKEASTNQDQAQALLAALNSYRQKNAREALLWDPSLGEFAKSRADHFASIGSTDSHAGFKPLLTPEGFEKMGYNALGENSSFGHLFDPTYIIESVYSDPAHNNNQLNPEWTHVGIGVTGLATDFVFGGRKR